jgi:hypothetical protein
VLDVLAAEEQAADVQAVEDLVRRNNDPVEAKVQAVRRPVADKKLVAEELAVWRHSTKTVTGKSVRTKLPVE